MSRRSRRSAASSSRACVGIAQVANRGLRHPYSAASEAVDARSPPAAGIADGARQQPDLAREGLRRGEEDRLANGDPQRAATVAPPAALAGAGARARAPRRPPAPARRPRRNRAAGDDHVHAAPGPDQLGAALRPRSRPPGRRGGRVGSTVADPRRPGTRRPAAGRDRHRVRKPAPFRRRRRRRRGGKPGGTWRRPEDSSRRQRVAGADRLAR